MIKLVGILVVAIGFALRLNTLLVIVAAGIVTGLASGLMLNEVMALVGRFFVIVVACAVGGCFSVGLSGFGWLWC